jgi:acetylornithine deacetylase
MSIDVLALTKRLIRIPSVFGEEGEIGEFIASHLSNENVILQKVPGFPPNVIARKMSSDDAPSIILNGHMDTVRPLSSWEHDPFKPRTKGNILYGGDL